MRLWLLLLFSAFSVLALAEPKGQLNANDCRALQTSKAANSLLSLLRSKKDILKLWQGFDLAKEDLLIQDFKNSKRCVIHFLPGGRVDYLPLIHEIPPIDGSYEFLMRKNILRLTGKSKLLENDSKGILVYGLPLSRTSSFDIDAPYLIAHESFHLYFQARNYKWVDGKTKDFGGRDYERSLAKNCYKPNQEILKLTLQELQLSLDTMEHILTGQDNPETKIRQFLDAREKRYQAIENRRTGHRSICQSLEAAMEAREGLAEFVGDKFSQPTKPELAEWLTTKMKSYAVSSEFELKEGNRSFSAFYSLGSAQFYILEYLLSNTPQQKAWVDFQSSYIIAGIKPNLSAVIEATLGGDLDYMSHLWQQKKMQLALEKFDVNSKPYAISTISDLQNSTLTIDNEGSFQFATNSSSPTKIELSGQVRLVYSPQNNDVVMSFEGFAEIEVGTGTFVNCLQMTLPSQWIKKHNLKATGVLDFLLFCPEPR